MSPDPRAVAWQRAWKVYTEEHGPQSQVAIIAVNAACCAYAAALSSPPVAEPGEDVVSHLPGVIQVIPLMPYVDHGCEVASNGKQLWAVSLPGAPGCIAQGSTLSEAVHALANIFPAYLERLFEAIAKSRSAAPQPAPEPPQWGEPNLAFGIFDSALLAAECGCWVQTVVTHSGMMKGLHCGRHSWADLVSGEARLRSAIEQGVEK